MLLALLSPAVLVISFVLQCSDAAVTPGDGRRMLRRDSVLVPASVSAFPLAGTRTESRPMRRLGRSTTSRRLTRPRR